MPAMGEASYTNHFSYMAYDALQDVGVQHDV